MQSVFKVLRQNQDIPLNEIPKWIPYQECRGLCPSACWEQPGPVPPQTWTQKACPSTHHASCCPACSAWLYDQSGPSRLGPSHLRRWEVDWVPSEHIWHLQFKGPTVLKHAFKDNSPRCEKSRVQQYGGILRVLPILLIQAENEGLNHQVSESVSSRGKHIGNAGVNGLIVSRVGGQLTGNEVWTNNVEQVVSESEDLVDAGHSLHPLV